MICRVDYAQLSKIPSYGPLILVGNHVNFLDAPILISHLHPRPITALVKEETWKNPLLGALFSIWKTIPIKRGEADRKAFRNALEALQQGKILAVAPEGTRSGHGQLQKGYPGVVLLALKSGATIQPIVSYGSEIIWRNIHQLSRTDFIIVVGNPFHLNVQGVELTREVREEITSEIMYQLAALLPEKYRGVYSDLENATEKYIVFDDGFESNNPVTQ